MRVSNLLARSSALHHALAEAVGHIEADPEDLRASVTLEALGVAIQHGQAVRLLLEAGLHVPAFVLWRVQYEALIKAVWACWVATDHHLRTLSAPLTPATIKAANGLGMAGEMLSSIEQSPAPQDLKRALREIRTGAWDVMNSYVHTSLHPLRRVGASSEHEVQVAVRMSNGLTVLAMGLVVAVGGAPERQADISVVCFSYPECLPARHMG